MSVSTHNTTWQQGEDGIISIVYKDSEGNPVDLTGASLRMDVADGENRLYTFNSEDLTDPVDTTKEATLGGTAGTIKIVIPRAASLTNGPLASSVGKVLVYDIFLRTGTTQKKLLQGTITIFPSVTKWV